MTSFYAVAAGRIPGIYMTWAECSTQVNDGFKGAKYKKFSTRQEAENFISNPVFGKSIKRPLDCHPNSTLSHSSTEEDARSLEFNKRKQKAKKQEKDFDPFTTPTGRKVNINEILYCDGGSNKQTKANGLNEAWGSVVYGDATDAIEPNRHLFDELELREVDLPVGHRTIVVFVAKDVASQNNNGAELLGMYMSCLIALKNKNKQIKVIYSDSNLIIDYWSRGHVSIASRAKMDPVKLYYINRLALLRQEFERSGGEIAKVPASRNLSDFLPQGMHV